MNAERTLGYKDSSELYQEKLEHTGHMPWDKCFDFITDYPRNAARLRVFRVKISSIEQIY